MNGVSNSRLCFQWHTNRFPPFLPATSTPLSRNQGPINKSHGNRAVSKAPALFLPSLRICT